MILNEKHKDVRNNNCFIGRINSIEYFNYKRDNFTTRAARFVVIENMKNPQSISFSLFGNMLKCAMQVRTGDLVKVFYKVYANKVEDNFYNNIEIKSIYKI